MVINNADISYLAALFNNIKHVDVSSSGVGNCFTVLISSLFILLYEKVRPFVHLNILMSVFGIFGKNEQIIFSDLTANKPSNSVFSIIMPVLCNIMT